jgi:hypothetical protein
MQYSKDNDHVGQEAGQSKHQDENYSGQTGSADGEESQEMEWPQDDRFMTYKPAVQRPSATENSDPAGLEAGPSEPFAGHGVNYVGQYTEGGLGMHDEKDGKRVDANTDKVSQNVTSGLVVDMYDDTQVQHVVADTGKACEGVISGEFRYYQDSLDDQDKNHHGRSGMHENDGARFQRSCAMKTDSNADNSGNLDGRDVYSRTLGEAPDRERYLADNNDTAQQTYNAPNTLRDLRGLGKGNFEAMSDVDECRTNVHQAAEKFFKTILSDESLSNIGELEDSVAAPHVPVFQGMRS